MYRFVLIPALAILALSCTRSPQQEVALHPNDSLFTIHEGPYHLELLLPKDLQIADPAEIVFNDATGELHIAIGEGFHLVLSQEEKDLAALKRSIAADDLFRNAITEEDASGVIYQQFLPTGDPYFFHLAAVRPTGSGNCVVQSWPLGEFTADQVKRMHRSVVSIAVPGT